MNRFVFRILVANSVYLIDSSTIKEILDNIDEHKAHTLSDYYNLISDAKPITKAQVVIALVKRFLVYVILLCVVGLGLVSLYNVLFQVFTNNEFTFFLSTYTAFLVLICILFITPIVFSIVSGLEKPVNLTFTCTCALLLFTLCIIVPFFKGSALQSQNYSNPQAQFSLYNAETFKPVTIHNTQAITVGYNNLAADDGVHFSYSIIQPPIYSTTIYTLADLYKLESAINFTAYRLTQRFTENEYDGATYTLRSDEANQQLSAVTDIEVNQPVGYATRYLYVYVQPGNTNNLALEDDPNSWMVTKVVCDTKSSDKNCSYVLKLSDVNDIIVQVKKE